MKNKNIILKKTFKYLTICFIFLFILTSYTEAKRRYKRSKNNKSIQIEIEPQIRFNDYSSNGLNDSPADFSIGILAQQGFLNPLRKFNLPFHFLSGLEFQYFGPSNNYATLQFIQIGAVGSFDFDMYTSAKKIYPALRLKTGLSIDQFIPIIDELELQTQYHLYLALSTGMGFKIHKNIRMHFFNELTWNFFSDKTIRIWSLTFGLSFVY